MPHERAVMGRSAVSQAMDHDDATDPSSQLADYYRWVEPDRGIRIYINFETADRLQVHVLRGLDSNGGVEVGGILLGRTELDEGRITAVIEDFEQVPCAYSSGPLYSATSADAARFEAALERYKSETSSGLSIVGYYRSHKRDDLYLSADDLTLIRRVFPGTDNVFLLIKPLSRRACTGGFFFWDDGNIQSEFTLEVPFAPVRPPSLTSSETDAIDDLLLPDRLDLSEDLTTIPPGLSREPGLPRHDRWHGPTRDLVAAAFGIVLSLGAFGYWQVRRSTVASHAPVAQEVTGSVQPAPIPVLTHSSEVEPAPIPSPSRQPIPLTQAQQESQPAVSGISNSSDPAQTPAVADPKLEQTASLPSEAKISELAVAPTAATPPPAIPNSPPPEIVPPRAELVIPAPPSAAVSNAEQGPPQLPSKTSFVGPQIIYRVNPAVPLDVRSLISGETQIDVTVKIDAAGKVTDAQVTSTQGAVARLVAVEAIKAARLFRFQPARENGRTVQSRMVLTFRFRRSGE